MWRLVRGRRFSDYKFRRQVPLGLYIVDFVCLEQKLVVEIDGGQHSEAVGYDSARTEWLESQGFQQTITVRRYPSPQPSSHKGRGGSLDVAKPGCNPLSLRTAWERVRVRVKVPNLYERARQLRRDSTDAERALWRLVRGRRFSDYGGSDLGRRQGSFGIAIHRRLQFVLTTETRGSRDLTAGNTR